ncbi:hypothetical protein [Streptomyces sp. NPDC002221]|uniref:hypothetical protein n=1 Tax=Streptomyces sp. NPDC002221 TaxID=3364639 RepID=UPI0036B5B632
MAQLASCPDSRLARLRAVLSDDPEVSRSASGLERNRPANVPAGAAVHVAARLEQGLELWDLEQDLLEVVRAFVGEEETTACGQAYRQASPRTAAGLFPEQISRLPVETARSARSHALADRIAPRLQLTLHR